MELVAEKKHSESYNAGEATNSTHSVAADSSSFVPENDNSAESHESRERHARELKAGLHPLKVVCFLLFD